MWVDSLLVLWELYKYFYFAEETMENVRLNLDWFEEDEKLRTDESKRQNKSQDSFSIQGSFKKLDID